MISGCFSGSGGCGCRGRVGAEEFGGALSLAEPIQGLHDLDHLLGIVAAVVHEADAQPVGLDSSLGRISCR